jgi:long-chain acyl-CoA synthetase
MNLVALADETIKSFGEYPFLIFDDKTFTNKQIIQDATKLACSLIKLGVKKGDNVVVMLPNCPEVIISYQGILRCGGVIVPLMPLMAQKELTHILDNCEAVAMITISDIFLKSESMLLSNKTLKNIILLDDAAPQGTMSFSQIIKDQPDKVSLPAIG